MADDPMAATLASEIPHVVIVGGGFGGLQAALHLKHANVRVTLLDRNNHHLFQPLLYQVATAGLSPGDIAAPIRLILAHQKNAEVLLAEVIAVEKAERSVTYIDQTSESTRSIHYDYLVIATGARHSYFGHEEWERFAPGLKSIADATEIRKRILVAFEAAELATDEASRSVDLTFLLVGAGPTGVEMAGSIAEMAHREFTGNFRHFDPATAAIILVEAGPGILSAFPNELAEKARLDLEKLGVQVRTSTKVEMIDENGATMNGALVRARTIIWCAGVAASPAAKWLGVEADRAGRVTVDQMLNIAGHPEIFVIGDTAASTNKDGKPLPGVAPVAIQQGRYVAKSIIATLGQEPQKEAFRYFNKGDLATIGRSKAILKLGSIKLSGFIAWVAGLFVHLFYLIGFRNRILVILQWAWAYFTYQRGVRLIIAGSKQEGASSKQEGISGKKEASQP